MRDGGWENVLGDLQGYEDRRSKEIAAQRRLATGDSSESQPISPDLPTRFGSYRLLGRLGDGGVGSVYLAQNERLDRQVAVKVLQAGGTATSEQLERFQIEARSAARLKHPNLVGVFDSGSEGSIPYLVMEYIPGVSLAEKLRQVGTLPPRQAASWSECLARALEHAHAQEVLHRDVKPGNVLLSPEGAPMLTDFGLAKDLSGRAMGPTVSGMVLGTPGYMSPEQARGKSGQVDARSDIYSLGATLYHMLTGQPPFLADMPSVVSPELKRICLKCLEREPERRYPTAKALGDDLLRYLQGGWLRPLPRGRGLLALGGILLISAALFLIALLVSLT